MENTKQVKNLINTVCTEFMEDLGGNDPFEIVKELMFDLNEVGCYKHDKIIMWFGHSWLDEECDVEPVELVRILMDSLQSSTDTMVQEIINISEDSNIGGQDLIDELMKVCSKHQASPEVLSIVVGFILGYTSEESGFTLMDSVELAGHLSKVK